MSCVQIEIPKPIHEKFCALAKREQITLEQLIANTLAEKISAMDQLEYLEARARRGSRAHFRRVLDQVPDVPPLPGDELPPGFKLPKKKRR